MTEDDKPDALVNEHVCFFEALQSRYEWPETQWGPIAADIIKLTKRSQDSRLFLGIIGEFSSGKSTLINALLREALLKTDILPATTCAATVIEYGATVDAVVLLQSGTTIKYSVEGLSFWGRLRRNLFAGSAIKELDRTRIFIHQYTAQEEQSRSVLRVTVTHPNEALRSGLVIVDTPGINVENPRHGAVTQDVVRNICDAIIVIVPAPAACSQTLIQFLKLNLTPFLHRCIVIVTKIDLIPSRERDQVMRFVASRLERELEGRVAAVLSAAPCYALDVEASASLDAAPEVATCFREAFRETEKTVIALLAASRSAIITEHLLTIEMAILKQIDSAIRLRMVEYAKRHKALEKNRLPNLAAFVDAHKKRYREEITQSTRKLGTDVGQAIDDFREELYDVIAKDIFAAANKAELKTAVTKTMRVRFKQAHGRLSSMSGTVRRHIVTLVGECHAEFQGDFTKHYRALATLGGLVFAADEADGMLLKTQAGAQYQTAQALAPVVEAVNKSKTATGVGAFSGAAIGTWLIPIPVVGTLVGGVLGWVFGSWFGPSLPELQQKAAADARSMVTVWGTDCKQSMMGIISQQIEQITRSLDVAIDRYASVYDAKVRKMIRQDDEAKAQLEDFIEKATKDIVELKRREDNARIALTIARAGASSKEGRQ